MNKIGNIIISDMTVLYIPGSAATVCFAPVSFISAAITLAPSRANTSQVARPMPLPPPIIRINNLYTIMIIIL